MIKALQSELTINVVASVIVSLLFLATGFLWGKYKERRRKFGRNLEDYVRVVRLIGKSFPNCGMEILLHNLADPAHSLIVLENNVTGRHLRDGTTNLLIDLKKRQLLNEEKLNYQLNIGSRKFKCTTIPISRKDFGIVGAICINVDVNYLTDEVMKSQERIETFFKNFCRSDMQLDENILSKDEYAKALKGKRHFKDEQF